MAKTTTSQQLLEWIEQNQPVRRADITRWLVDRKHGTGTFDSDPYKWRGYWSEALKNATEDNWACRNMPKGRLTVGPVKVIRRWSMTEKNAAHYFVIRETSNQNH